MVYKLYPTGQLILYVLKFYFYATFMISHRNKK